MIDNVTNHHVTAAMALPGSRERPDDELLPQSLLCLLLLPVSWRQRQARKTPARDVRASYAPLINKGGRWKEQKIVPKITATTVNHFRNCFLDNVSNNYISHEALRAAEPHGKAMSCVISCIIEVCWQSADEFLQTCGLVYKSQ